MIRQPRRPPLPAATAVAIGLAVGIWLAACGGAKARTSPQSTGAAMMGRTTDQHDEISRLDAEIAEARKRLSLAAPTPEQIAAAESRPMATGSHCDAVARAPTPACTDSCTLAGSICDNAERICQIADELAPDAWASEKCGDARATCDLAHERCCGCA